MRPFLLPLSFGAPLLLALAPVFPAPSEAAEKSASSATAAAGQRPRQPECECQAGEVDAEISGRLSVSRG